jgi:hypothetical protein
MMSRILESRLREKRSRLRVLRRSVMAAIWPSQALYASLMRISRNTSLPSRISYELAATYWGDVGAASVPLPEKKPIDEHDSLDHHLFRCSRVTKTISQ